MLKTIRDIALTILIAFALFIGLRYTIEGYTVRYVCMMPGICDGDWILVNKAIYFFTDPQRGDVSVFWPPEDKVNSDYPFIKRVIALPGETIEIIDGDVLVNGIIITEKYIKEAPSYTMQEKYIPMGEYFMLGDNRNNANDSHSWGTVPRENFVGKAIITYWPLDKWGKIKHYNYPELDLDN
jgi:signal peptidase I